MTPAEAAPAPLLQVLLMPPGRGAQSLHKGNPWSELWSSSKQYLMSFNLDMENPPNKTRLLTKICLISASLLSFVIFMPRGQSTGRTSGSDENTVRSSSDQSKSFKSNDKSLWRKIFRRRCWLAVPTHHNYAVINYSSIIVPSSRDFYFCHGKLLQLNIQ